MAIEAAAHRRFAGMLNRSDEASTLRAGFGCLGCLTKTALILLVGSVLIIAINAVFTPWAFYFGGKTHFTPTWTGIGHLRASSGDYVLNVRSLRSRAGSVLHLRISLDGATCARRVGGNSLRERPDSKSTLASIRTGRK